MTNKAGYFAAIFTSKRSMDHSDDYHEMAARMLELAKVQPGFLGIDSARGSDGVGITVSYWQTEEAIRAWKDHSEHMDAQSNGRALWYEWFNVRVCKVEREYSFGVQDDRE